MALVHEQSTDGAMSTPAGGGSSETQPQGSFSGAIASSPIPSTSLHHHQQHHHHHQQLAHQHHLSQQQHHQTHSHGGGEQREHQGGYMFHSSAGSKYGGGNSNYPQMEAAQGDPMTVSESNTHCTALFEKLRMQREQGRYCDLVLSIQGRQFPAHRCVLASCSPWFDSRLKMHKTMKEEIAVDCQNLEAFYAVLTYCYTGQISIDKDCVAELLYLADYFAISKLKAYCSDYINRGISLRNVFSVLDLAMKCNASELLKLSSVLILRNFSRIHDRVEMLNLTLNKVQMLLSDREWQVPQEAVLNFICNWVNYHVASREDHFISLLQYVNWGQVSVSFICDHIDKHPLYQTSPDAMFTILHVVIDRQGIVLGPKYQTAYQNLQEKLLPDQELDELNDSNSFLSIAINSAVKDLEQSEVDPDWFLQGSETAGPPGVVVPPGGPSPSMQLARQDSTASTSAAAAQLSSVDFEIAEQVINEQQLSEEKNYKYVGGAGPTRDVNAVKRYDPKYRALTEAFRQMVEDNNDAPTMNHDAGAAPGVSITESAVASQDSAVPVVKASTKEQGLEYYKYPSYTPMGFRPQSEQGVSNTDVQGQSGFIDAGSKNASHQGAQNWQHSPVQVPTGFSTPPPPQRNASDAPSLQGQYILSDADYGNGHHRHLGQEGLQGSDGKEEVPGAVENEVFDIPPGRSSMSTDPEESLVTPKKMSPLSFPTPTKKRHFSTLGDDYEEAKAEMNITRNNNTGGAQTQKQHVKKAKLLAEHRSSKTNEQLPQKEQSKSYVSEAPGEGKDVNKVFLCPFCDHSNQSPKQLRNHVRSNHAMLKPPYKCPHCAFSSERLHLLVVHKAEKHDPRIKESGCDNREIENDPVVANNSADIGDGDEESKYSELCCPVQDCGFVGKSKSKLELHAKLHGRRHGCKECKKSFPTSTALKIHLISHTSDREYRCSEPGCPFQTKYKSYLTLHGRKHNGKAHVCEVCGYTTLKMSLLQCHKRTHTNEKIFVCSECQKGFVEKSQLTRHQKTQHSDEKPFACSQCKFSCKRKDKLKLHVRRLHPTSQVSK